MITIECEFCVMPGIGIKLDKLSFWYCLEINLIFLNIFIKKWRV